MKRFADDVRTGLFYGGFAGVVYSAYVVVATLATRGQLLEQFGYVVDRNW